MNYLAGLLALLLCAATITAAGYRNHAESLQNQLNARIIEEQQAVLQAKQDAQKQEATDQTALANQAATAISQATQQAASAQTALGAYRAKLLILENAPHADPATLCAALPVPAAILDGLQQSAPSNSP